MSVTYRVVDFGRVRYAFAERACGPLVAVSAKRIVRLPSAGEWARLAQRIDFSAPRAQ